MKKLLKKLTKLISECAKDGTLSEALCSAEYSTYPTFHGKLF